MKKVKMIFTMFRIFFNVTTVVEKKHLLSECKDIISLLGDNTGKLTRMLDEVLDSLRSLQDYDDKQSVFAHLLLASIIKSEQAFYISLLDFLTIVGMIHNKHISSYFNYLLNKKVPDIQYRMKANLKVLTEINLLINHKNSLKLIDRAVDIMNSSYELVDRYQKVLTEIK